MKVPYIKAIDKDTGKEVQGFYFEYPETSYCFTEDYEKSPVKMIPCVVFYTMTDWGLPNRPMLCQNIDKDSIKLIRYVDIDENNYICKRLKRLINKEYEK